MSDIQVAGVALVCLIVALIHHHARLSMAVWCEKAAEGGESPR